MVVMINVFQKFETFSGLCPGLARSNKVVQSLWVAASPCEEVLMNFVQSEDVIVDAYTPATFTTDANFHRLKITIG